MITPRLHRERGAERFPAPGEVLVDASRLDVAEKTLILFRHAKAADLPPETWSWLKNAGAQIVSHPHFAPERIRRFTARLKTTPDEENNVPSILGRELTNPTDAMGASFASFETEHRDLLIAMLDTAPGPVSERELGRPARSAAGSGGAAGSAREHQPSDRSPQITRCARRFRHPVWMMRTRP